MTILQNEIKCNECGEQIYSAHRHDFRYCKCGQVAVDGGMDYLRRLGSGYEDKSIVVDEKHVNALEGIINDTEHMYNSLGKVCAIARYMRDYMDINISTEEAA